MKYFLQAFKQYVDFNGRTRRKAYWLYILFNNIFSILALTLDILLNYIFESEGLFIVTFLYTLVVLLPGLSISVRRLHDSGKPGPYLFIGLIPLFGMVAYLAYMSKEGDNGPNQYGDDPKSKNDTYSEEIETSAQPATLQSSSSPFALPSFFSSPSRRTIHSLVMIGVQSVILFMIMYGFFVYDTMNLGGLFQVLINPRNISNIVLHLLPVAFISLGVSFVVSRGSYDFSMPGVIYLSSTICASLMANEGFGGMFVSLAAALFIGIINAIVAIISKRASFLIPIATGFLAHNIGLLVSKGAVIPLSGSFDKNIHFSIFLPVLAIIGISSILLLQFPGKLIKLKSNTSVKTDGFIGRFLCIGWPYLVSALLAGITGLALLKYFNASLPSIAKQYELSPVLAIMLSGSFLGARYSNTIGILTGSLFIAIVINIMSLLGISYPFQLVLLSTILILCFIFNAMVVRIMFPQKPAISNFEVTGNE